jgi:hypothetical protein
MFIYIFNDPFGSSDYMTSNERIINEQRIGKDLFEECDHALIGGNTPVRGWSAEYTELRKQRLPLQCIVIWLCACRSSLSLQGESRRTPDWGILVCIFHSSLSTTDGAAQLQQRTCQLTAVEGQESRERFTIIFLWEVNKSMLVTWQSVRFLEVTKIKHETFLTWVFHFCTAH